MTKKEYLMKLLEVTPTDILPIKKDLLYLIQNDNVTDGLMDSLYNIFHEYGKSIKDKWQKMKMEKTMEVLKKLKQIEEDSDEGKKDLAKLEDMLSDI